MYISFSELSNTNKVWIYTSNKAFSEEQMPLVEKKLKDLCEHWMVHGQPLKASFQIIENQMIVLFSDEIENQASGCSIDSSVRALKEIESTFGVELFDRWNVALEVNGSFMVKHVNQMKKDLASGTLSGEDLIYKTELSSKEEFLNNHKEKIKDSAYSIFVK
jgi:hypothetical protein